MNRSTESCKHRQTVCINVTSVRLTTNQQTTTTTIAATATTATKSGPRDQAVLLFHNPWNQQSIRIWKSPIWTLCLWWAAGTLTRPTGSPYQPTFTTVYNYNYYYSSCYYYNYNNNNNNFYYNSYCYCYNCMTTIQHTHTQPFPGNWFQSQFSIFYPFLSM